MEEKRDFVLPQASEKLSYRFILDTLKEKASKREVIENLEVSFTEMDELPGNKKYFRIGEVSSLLKVEPYVLRYWESEFKTIKPVKAGSGHRVYTRKDVETLQMIKHLLYNEKFSIKGAKKKLLETKKEVKIISQPNTRALKEIASELKELVNFLRTNSL
jgi:DNA-binding transcriptional MerR regulator